VRLFRNVLDKIPVLSLSHEWTKNLASSLYETPVIEKFRTNKLEVPLVLYNATDKHPAQTKTVIKDVTVVLGKRNF